MNWILYKKFIGRIILLVLAIGLLTLMYVSTGAVTEEYKQPVAEMTDPYEAVFDFSLVKDKVALDMFVSDYYLTEGYDDTDRTCGQVLERDYGIEHTGDFVPDAGAEEHVVRLIAYCGLPVAGAGGNGPYLVVSRTEAGYRLIGELFGEEPIIEEPELNDAANVPDILVIQDDAPPGNFHAQKWVWDAESSYYIERYLSGEEETRLLRKYLGDTYRPKNPPTSG